MQRVSFSWYSSWVMPPDACNQASYYRNKQPSFPQIWFRLRTSARFTWGRCFPLRAFEFCSNIRALHSGVTLYEPIRLRGARDHFFRFVNFSFFFPWALKSPSRRRECLRISRTLGSVTGSFSLYFSSITFKVHIVKEVAGHRSTSYQRRSERSGAQVWFRL